VIRTHDLVVSGRCDAAKEVRRGSDVAEARGWLLAVRVSDSWISPARIWVYPVLEAQECVALRVPISVGAMVPEAVATCFRTELTFQLILMATSLSR